MPASNTKSRIRIAFLHTVPTLTDVMERLLHELTPDVSAFHLYGEGLLELAAQKGNRTSELEDRVVELIQMGVDIGSDAVLVTCSTIGPCAETARQLVSVPVFRIDEPMATEAVQLGTRITVLATTPTTLAPTEDLICRKAIAMGRKIDLDLRLCKVPTPTAGKDSVQVRDATLVAAIRDAADTADVVVLAQASMAAVLERNPLEIDCPVLTSPRSGILQLQRIG